MAERNRAGRQSNLWEAETRDLRAAGSCGRLLLPWATREGRQEGEILGAVGDKDTLLLIFMFRTGWDNPCQSCPVSMGLSNLVSGEQQLRLSHAKARRTNKRGPKSEDGRRYRGVGSSLVSSDYNAEESTISIR